MSKDRKLCIVVLAVVFLLLAALACSPPAAGDTPGMAAADAPSVTITDPPSGTTVMVGEEIKITSYATAAAGVDRVELSISGLAVRSDAPPGGNPTSFSVVQAWTPEKAGDVIVSVVAYDTTGTASEPAMTVLQVTVAGTGVMPTLALTLEPIPTSTPEPDVPGGGGCKLNAAYVADVTVPDNTPLAPSTPFVKTWRIRNSSTCDWGVGFDLVFVRGDRMGGEAAVAVPATAADTAAEVSVHLTAPTTSGTYRGEWRMRSDEGVPFGSVVYVQIVVPGATEVPTKEATAEPTEPAFTMTPTPQPIAGVASYYAYPPFVPGMSGYVTDHLDGYITTPDVIVGDNKYAHNFQGLVTFNVSSLKAGITVKSAEVNLGECQVNGDGGLGALSIFNHQYGEPDASDFDGGGTLITSVTSPYCHKKVDVTDTVQARVGESQYYYQLRLAFSPSDLDDQFDWVHFYAPTLTVVYSYTP